MFNRFLEVKWNHVGTKIQEKTIQIARRDFFDKSYSGCSGGLFLEGPRVEVGIKNQSKSTKNWSPRWIASWHRFLMDFGGFWEASWGAKSNQERQKIGWKTNRKNNEKKMCFGCPWGGGNMRRAIARGGSWDPLTTNYQIPTLHHRPQIKTHKPLDALVTPYAHQRGGGYLYL